MHDLPWACLRLLSRFYRDWTELGRCQANVFPLSLFTVGGNVNWCSHYGKQYGSSLKTKNKITTWSSNSTLGCLSGKDKNSNLRRHMLLSTVYNSQERAKHPSTDNWLKKIYMYVCMCVYTRACRLSHWVMSDFLWSHGVVCQSPLSMGFPREEDWNRVPFCGLCVGRLILYHWATWETIYMHPHTLKRMTYCHL